MTAAVDITGQRYGRLVALKRVASRKLGRRHYDTMWLFRCDCGIEKEITLSRVRSGSARSCGCLRDDYRHSKSKKAQLHVVQPQAAVVVTKDRKCTTAAYHAWVAMKQVSTNPNNPGYPYYDGRGIRVCARWRDSLENFYADIGDRPHAGMWLVRIDKQGDYEPTNVQWEVRPRRTRRRHHQSDGAVVELTRQADQLLRRKTSSPSLLRKSD